MPPSAQNILTSIHHLGLGAYGCPTVTGRPHHQYCTSPVLRHQDPITRSGSNDRESVVTDPTGAADERPHQGDPATLKFSGASIPEITDVDYHLRPDDEATIAAMRPGTALLIVSRGPNRGARFLLDSAKTTVGRRPDSDIFLDDVTVSRRHAIFELTGTEFTVRDVQSLNGTYVNRAQTDSAVLRSGDEVQVGKFRLLFYTPPAR